MKIYVSGVAALVLVAAMIGCGGGGDTTEAALTKAQFISRGDKICHAAMGAKEKAVEAWVQEAKEEGKTLSDFNENELAGVYVKTSLPSMKKASDELAALPLPSGDVMAKQMVKSMAAAVASVEKEPRRAIKAAPFVPTDQLARAYGFKVCGHL